VVFTLKKTGNNPSGLFHRFFDFLFVLYLEKTKKNKNIYTLQVHNIAFLLNRIYSLIYQIYSINKSIQQPSIYQEEQMTTYQRSYTTGYSNSNSHAGQSKTGNLLFGIGIVLALAGIVVIFYKVIEYESNRSKNSENMVAQRNVRQPDMVSIDKLSSREVGEGNKSVPTNMHESQASPSQFAPRVNLRPEGVNIMTPNKIATNPAMTGSIVNNVRKITRGEGVVQPMAVDGNPIPEEVVEYGLFENHEFYPRVNEFPLHSSPHVFDPTQTPPKSHFGPMTYPIKGPIGELGMDYMRAGGKDTRVNIAQDGGRH
jgi:hypothetical protein